MSSSGLTGKPGGEMLTPGSLRGDTDRPLLKSERVGVTAAGTASGGSQGPNREAAGAAPRARGQREAVWLGVWEAGLPL